MKQDAIIKAKRENKLIYKWWEVIEKSKKNPVEANRMVTNRKNMMPEPNTRRAMDAVLALFPDFCSIKKLRIGDMDPFGLFMG